MAASRVPVRVLAALSLVCSVLLPAQGASAAPTCDFDLATHTVSITAMAGETSIISVMDAKIVVSNTMSTCMDGAVSASPTNTDLINITGTTGNESLLISRPADFAPGFDSAEAGTAEIEWNVNLGAGTDSLVIAGEHEVGESRDYIRMGTDGINTLGDEAAPVDVDIALSGVDSYQFYLQLGDDILDLSGSGVAASLPTTASTVTYGGEGADTVIGGNGSDQISGEQGDDDISGLNAGDSLSGGPGGDDISGGAADDSLTDISADKDMISGGTGTDTLDVSGRTEDLYISFDGLANDGARPGCPSLAPPCEGDMIGAETAVGSGNGDIENIYIGDGDDLVFGNSAANTINTGSGSDEVHGGAGNDQLNPRDYTTDIGSRRIYGDAGEDTVYGATSNDVLHGGPDNDYVIGGDGNDTLRPGGGVDIPDGEAGIDTFEFTDATEGASASLVSGISNDGFGNAEAPASIENLIGSAYNDNLQGDLTDNILEGGAGADIVQGSEGNDTLRGGAAVDLLSGGLGNDRLAGNAGNDSVDGGPDIDIADYSGTKAVSVNLATQKATGAGTDVLNLIESLIGSSRSDKLLGNARVNRIVAGKGNDRIVPGRGKDFVDAGAGSDTVLARDRARDRLFGGTGRDRGEFDRFDFRRNFEIRI